MCCWMWVAASLVMEDEELAPNRSGWKECSYRIKSFTLGFVYIKLLLKRQGFVLLLKELSENLIRR